jgi:TolB-like protein/Tfp pilus assembly protein PilF
MAGLFGELKRRNVFKVGAAYVVMAWLIAQGVDVFLENFGAPEWVIKTILLLLVAGLPVALFFAWAFELTPEGIKKEKDVDRSQSITHETGRKLDYTIIAVLLVALTWFAWDKFSTTPPAAIEAAAPTEAVAPAEAAKSIAVLPFVNMSEDASNEYFSDGISEEILNALAKVKELKVAGRTSSFAFKGQNDDLRKIGETLGVENILEGSVRKSGDQVRITAQLIQVDTGFHLWSESYDRKLENVFAIQDEIANAILIELKATLLEGEAELIQVARADSQAYDLYLLGKQRMYDRTKLSLESAAELLDQAIAIDPDYAPAYAQRGITALLLSVTSYGNIPQQQSLTQAKLYLDKALQLDENLAEAWAGFGLYYSGPPNRPHEQIEVLEKALSINPNMNDAANWLAMGYWSVNRGQDSLATLQQVTQRDPLYKPAMGNLSFLLAMMGRGDEARAHLESVEPFMQGDPNIASNLAWIDDQEGKVAQALKRMQAALEMQPTDRVYRAGVNAGYYQTHQYEEAFDDEWSDAPVWALLNLDRHEEATLLAQKRANEGLLRPLFGFLNATNQSQQLVQYFEQRWPGIDEFEKEFPPAVWGYREMLDVAYAYQQIGNQQRFGEALAALAAANQQALENGMQGPDLKIIVAAQYALSGDEARALEWLGDAIDGGLIVSTRISREYPYFRELDGLPEFEAIQARMIEHLNRERAELGLEPVSA